MEPIEHLSSRNLLNRMVYCVKYYIKNILFDYEWRHVYNDVNTNIYSKVNSRVRFMNIVRDDAT